MTDQPAKPEAASAEGAKNVPVDQIVQTKHTVTIGGRKLRYTVTTGTLILKQESEKKGDKAGESEGALPKAAVFFVAYTLATPGDPARRPVTFSFNGGPGSSSVWLHLGVLGPRRVDMGEEGDLPAPPFRLTENEHSLLDVSDLVFIDPVSTGYSRPVTGEKAKEFHTFRKDIESVGDFIRLYTTRYRRWLSPKFLIGESYGTTRAAGLSGYLQERHGMYLNGLMLVSSVLEFQTLHFEPNNDLPCVLFIPSYAATAWYHGRLARELQRDRKATLAQARAFALDRYAPALLQGTNLPARERAEIVTQLARFTGLSAAFIERCNLRVEISHFTKELLREQSRTVGRLDSRFTGIDRDAAGATPDSDPSFTNIMGPYTAAFYDYVRGELKYESDLPYEILSFKTHEGWRYDDHENRFVDVAETLRKSITMNPHLKVFVANGYYDLATPFFATEYTFSRLGLDESLRGNISMRYYDGGHMMYIHRPSLAILKKDLAAFVRGAMGARPKGGKNARAAAPAAPRARGRSRGDAGG
ncbi:MAG: peptidase S10 [Candidatus Eisenbacteria bacterium]